MKVIEPSFLTFFGWNSVVVEGVNSLDEKHDILIIDTRGRKHGLYNDNLWILINVNVYQTDRPKYDYGLELDFKKLMPSSEKMTKEDIVKELI